MNRCCISIVLCAVAVACLSCSRCTITIVGVYPEGKSHFPFTAKGLLELRQSEVEVISEDDCDIIDEVDEWIRDENISLYEGTDRRMVVLLVMRSDGNVDTVSWWTNQFFLYYNGDSYKGNCRLFEKVISKLPAPFAEYFFRQEILPCTDN